MITSRTAQECGKADYGWLQARYTFSFGHYFDPQLMGYASLRVLNQDVLTPASSFQPRTYPMVYVLNLILQGDAEYRDIDGNHVTALQGEALLFATQPTISYSEHNLSKDRPLTRMQLWLDACPERENAAVQRMTVDEHARHTLMASPDGQKGSLQLRQQVWIHHLLLEPGESYTVELHGSRAYLQSIHGSLSAVTHSEAEEKLICGDGAFIREEESVTLRADTPLRALVIDLPV